MAIPPNDSDQIGPLKYLMTIIKERDKQYREMFKSRDKAIRKKERADDKRFEGVNEFRHSLDDYQKQLVTKSEFQSSVSAINQKTDAESRASIQRSETNSSRLDKLEAALNRTGGAVDASKEKNDNTKYVIGIAITIAGFLLALAIAIGPHLR